MSNIEDFERRLVRLEEHITPKREALSHKQAAALLGWSAETLRRHENRGEGPPRKRVGLRTWVYPLEQLRKWMSEQHSTRDTA
jgi:predicted DNA-binding transcriptional regulator AlpA